MPRVLIQEIRGYVGNKDYYCPRCGLQLSLATHIDRLLMEEDLKELERSSFIYCNICGEKLR